MALVNYNDVGQIGVLFGPSPDLLPRNAWSNGHNVRAVGESIGHFPGYMSVFGAPSVDPYWSIPVQTPSNYYWVYAGLAKVYVWNGTAHTNITRQDLGNDVDYSASALNGWNGGIIGGIPVLNNGVDIPQVWAPVSPAQRLQNLPAWPSNVRAAVLRPYLNFLVACDVTISSQRYPMLVKWSHAAAPGTVPSSWDETDPTLDAGEVDLSGSHDFIVDTRPLRSDNYIYTTGATWLMQYVGHPSIFRFTRVFSELGAFTRGCVLEIDGKHIVVSSGDIVVHDGQQPVSIFPKKLGRSMAKAIFDDMDSTAYVKARLVKNSAAKEVWFIYPLDGSSACNRAFVWNYRENSFSLRDLPDVDHATEGLILTDEAQDWDSDTNPWDTDTSPWNESRFSAFSPGILMASAANSKLYKADIGVDADGSPMSSFVERTAIPVTDGPQANVPRYLVTEVFPKISSSGPVEILVGGQERLGGPVTWHGPYLFNPLTQKCVKCHVSTPLPALRVQAPPGVEWEMTGYSLNVHGVGFY